MIRFLVLLVAALLALGFQADGVGGVALAATAQAADDDCCPGEADQGESDCCDWDFGACCALGVAAVLPPPSLDAHGPRPALGAGGALPLHLLRPRAHGPPPTPPPIG